jgi:hypothetical protein
MNRKTVSICGVLCTAVVAGYLAAPTLASLSTGCDITVSRLGMSSSSSADDFQYYGTSSGVRAFSVASTSCNAGTTTCDWIDSHSGGTAGRHPTIFANAFRLLEDTETGASRFEQIGMSWGKHSFCAVSEPTCASMVNGSCIATGCSTLGIGCADTYWAGLNGEQGDLGPRSQVNPWPNFGSPTHTTYNTPGPSYNATIRGRLQILDTDITTNMSQGAPDGGTWDTEQNFVEVVYTEGGDEETVNRNNNGSWREVNINLTSISGVGQGPSTVHFMEYAIQAWRANVPGVGIKTVDVPGNGRYHVGWQATELASGNWLYEYAVYNGNSNIEGTSFSVPTSPALTITNAGFRSPFYHSGDGAWPNNQSNTPWAFSEVEGGFARWDMVTGETVPNELGFGTLYNFRFEADAAPVFGAQVQIGLENGSTLFVAALGPGEPDIETPCPGDTNDDGVVDVNDLNNVFLDWGTDGSANGGDVAGATPGSDPDGIVDVNDLNAIITNWGTCPA